MKVTIEINTEDKSTIIAGLSLLAHLNTDTVEAPEPKKTVKTPKATPKTKKAPEKPETPVETPTKEDTPKEEVKQEGITLSNLKDRAKDKAQSAGREKVKACIGEFAQKLTEVDEADYGKLYKKLGDL